eukprot:m.373353 g.373353  ORF g.373353 m.373353 type:complete len:70 (+) comp16690_c0_seq16:2677-2886(+)
MSGCSGISGAAPEDPPSVDFFASFRSLAPIIVRCATSQVSTPRVLITPHSDVTGAQQVLRTSQTLRSGK